MAALSLLVVLQVTAGIATAAVRPDFSGSWRIDLAASDPIAGDLGRRLAEQQRENTSRDILDLQAEGEAFGGEQRTSNRQRRDNDNLGGATGAFFMSRLLRYVVTSGASWTVEQSEERIRLVTADGATLSLYPGHDPPSEVTGEDMVEARWKGKRLVSTRRLDERSTIRQTWKLLDEGRMEVVSRMSVNVTPRNPVRPLSLRLVYEREPGP